MEFKLKQSEVAEIFNVSVHTIRFWELNQCIPTKKRMPQIMEFLGYLSENKLAVMK